LAKDKKEAVITKEGSYPSEVISRFKKRYIDKEGRTFPSSQMVKPHSGSRVRKFLQFISTIRNHYNPNLNCFQGKK
jgi:hypothetical protein